MALTRSLTNGASSLQAHQSRFDVISNNISNVNTTGYKSTRANFAEQFNQIYTYGKSPDSQGGIGVGGVNPVQYGLGVKVGSVTIDTTQGNIDSTDRALDLALQGDGFFVYSQNGNQIYSRAGEIQQDETGAFVDSSTGAYLQGYNLEIDANGRIVKDSTGANILSRTVSNLSVSSNIISDPHQTENVTITGNLNSDAETGAQKSTSINIFDNQGAAHSLEITFTKSATANTYSASFSLDGTAISTANTTITFNDDGTLSTPLSIQITGANLNNAIGTNVFDTTKNLSIKLADSSSLTTGLTQYSMDSTATATEQDGYQAGSLIDLSVDTNGKIWGAFSNGESEVLGQVVIAKFANPAALTKVGNNFYDVSPNSGSPNIGTAGEIFPSTSIQSNSLEASNVDLTEEFVNIINTQRAFEAASRTITVTDQMLSEVNNLKR
jgi:flagellar hook protein FlgE